MHLLGGKLRLRQVTRLSENGHETELRVLVAPLSSPHRTRVLATLRGELNVTATTFPGSNLILRYDVDEVGKR